MSGGLVYSITRVGACSRFFFRLLAAIPGALRRPRAIIDQVYFVGGESLIIIGISGGFVGLVLGLQGYNSMSIIGAEGRLGAVVAVSLFRELGPVLTALLFAGRAGTSIAAEIGLMKATEQLDALDAMAIDPMKRVIAPRFIAALIAVPLLTAIFCALGILGAYVIGVRALGVDEGLFWSNMIATVELQRDLAHGLYKAIAFGIIAGLIAVFEGSSAEPTGSGVANATTQTVVYTAIVMLALDFIITAWLL